MPCACVRLVCLGLPGARSPELAPAGVLDAGTPSTLGDGVGLALEESHCLQLSPARFEECDFHTSRQALTRLHIRALAVLLLARRSCNALQSTPYRSSLACRTRSPLTSHATSCKRYA